MKTVVLIPAYKDAFDADEEACVKRYVRVLKDRDLVFILPDGLDSRYYAKVFPTVGQRRFDARFFKGTGGYNRLLLSEGFYRAFDRYDYMLIAQPDAVIWQDEDRLDENGKFELNRAGLAAYSHGEYFALGRKLGSFGFSVRRKEKR